MGIVYAQSAPLAAGTYAGAITLRDDLNGADVTPEVVAERDVHQFFYAFTPAAGASRVAGRLVSRDRATVIVVGDAAKFIDPLRAIRPDVEVIKASDLDLDAAVLKGASR